MSLSASPESAVGHCTPSGENAGSATSTAHPAGEVAPDHLELSIAGMTCGHCVSAVREALDALPGVNVHRVGLGSASVTLEPEGASPSALVEAIREAGYQASFAGGAASAKKTGLPQAPSGTSCCSTR